LGRFCRTRRQSSCYDKLSTAVMFLAQHDDVTDWLYCAFKSYSLVYPSGNGNTLAVLYISYSVVDDQRHMTMCNMSNLYSSKIICQKNNANNDLNSPESVILTVNSDCAIPQSIAEVTAINGTKCCDHLYIIIKHPTALTQL